jgi:hypothetical protein
MKNTPRFLIAAAALALFASAGQIQAQSQLTTDDGVAASPRVRQALTERRISANLSQPMGGSDVASCTTACCAADGKKITASPKVQQMLAERRKVGSAAVSSGSQVAGYRATGTDGISASPKVRAVLDERRQTVEIAPLK